MQLLENVFLTAKAGDRVWSTLRGCGEVIDNKNGMDVPHPILVEFDYNEPGFNGIYAYNYAGMCLQNTLYPELFWKKQKPGCITARPQPDIDWKCVPVDTPVLVSNAESNEGCEAIDLSDYEAMRFVTYMPVIEKFVCFSNEEDSETAQSMSYWSHCIIHPNVTIPSAWVIIPF